jgi:hypothetical protein
MLLVEPLEQTQYPIRIPTFGLKQLILIPKGVFVQYTTVGTLLINIHVANGLLSMVMMFIPTTKKD